MIHLRRFERGLFHDVILISQSQKNRRRLRSALTDAMLQSTRSQEQKLPIERPLLEDCMHFIKTGTYKKNLVSFSLLTSSNRRIKQR